MMEHSQPVSRDTPSNVRDILLSENRFGAWFAETIRASGRVRRTNRPDTRLLLTSANQFHKCLAMQELSTQAIRTPCSIFHLHVPTTLTFRHRPMRKKQPMQRTIRYLSHPQVYVDPNTPIPEWSLNEAGKNRVDVLAKSGLLAGTKLIVSSAETKAIETATPLVSAIGCDFDIRNKMHENDRSATGFLPPDEFETVADQFFAHPTASVRGWETAQAAQSRIVAEVEDCLRKTPVGDILFVGHGGVGTLLFCHLSGYDISREYDQGPGGGGCIFEFSDFQDRPKKRWQTMESWIEANGR